jgi:hypothetical protein
MSHGNETKIDHAPKKPRQLRQPRPPWYPAPAPPNGFTLNNWNQRFILLDGHAWEKFRDGGQRVVCIWRTDCKTCGAWTTVTATLWGWRRELRSVQCANCKMDALAKVGAAGVRKADKKAARQLAKLEQQQRKPLSRITRKLEPKLGDADRRPRRDPRLGKFGPAGPVRHVDPKDYRPTE